MIRRDFTLELLGELIKAIKMADYKFVTYSEYMNISSHNKKLVVLRHDIDARPEKALRIAEFERELAVKGTYYVRMKGGLYDRKIIRRIISYGNELGYHYENLSKHKGNYVQAFEEFRANLAILRKDYPVTTICMHGSPLSRFDNKDIWEKFSYKDLGIDAELYLDTDFDDIWYITDTGRAWNSRFSIRDKVTSRFFIDIKDTFSLIDCFNKCILPTRIMITIHPQRWADHYLDWAQEAVSQQIKNIAKAVLRKSRKVYARQWTLIN